MKYPLKKISGIKIFIRELFILVVPMIFETGYKVISTTILKILLSSATGKVMNCSSDILLPTNTFR